MTTKSLGLALAAAVAGFLLVGVAVTAVTGRWVEFSVFLGLPAGLVAGALLGAAAYVGLESPSPQRNAVAGGFVAFALGFLLGFLILAGVFRVGVTTALGVAVVLGLAVGLVEVRRRRTG
ncbi:hypothetical protein RH831_10175 [Halodesulfurarchaeum sp. HSR-GB]|uniref:hypothetical protein n=1 Tax=Halodesulfurarchaeum sp. HSR-GB TaxID=3074077 RepID=UPI00285CE580|nr:hypothetical protein [Halodesulfurarchaeum sp. HSR-GB]MDR5657542.1 hypothetical protein [Halodesulfurarchaeum sp. HSR-GB]